MPGEDGPPSRSANQTADDDPLLFEWAAMVADGESLDVPGVEAPASDSGLLKQLDIIARLASAHKAVPSETVSASLADVLGALADHPTPDLSNATRWGPLLILGFVDGGHFGQVYRAWYPALDQEVALKRLRVPGDGGPHESALLREGKLLARVRHPNVITVHGAVEVDGEVGIWMDLVHGRSLERLVQDDGTLSGQEATIVGESLCRALGAVHQAGVLHRDLKASNVMRESGGRIVLVDFGSGGDVAPAEFTPQRLVGTPLYMAPELFAGSPASVESDIYSLGVLLFYLVTGSHPVSGRSLADVRKAHLTGRRVRLSDTRPDLPTRFTRIVDRALDPDPAQRFHSCGALLRELESATPQAEVASPRRALLIAVLGATGVAVWLLLLGYVTSASYRLHTGLTGRLGAESVGELFQWGAKNVFPSAVYMTVAVTLAYVGTSVVRIVRRLLPRAPASIGGVGRRMQGWVQRVRLDRAETAGTAFIAVGLLAFAGIYVAFSRLIAAVTSTIDTAPVNTLTMLDPAAVRTHDLFGFALDMLTLAMVAGLVVVVRLARRTGDRVPTGATAGLAILACLAMGLHAAAWRVIYKSDFRQVLVDGERCYLLAQSDDELLVNCPGADVPRNRMFHPSDTRVVRTQVVENISLAYVRAAAHNASVFKEE